MFYFINLLFLVYKYYTWFVVLGYCQIVYDLEKQGDKVKIFDKGFENYPLYPRKY